MGKLSDAVTAAVEAAHDGRTSTLTELLEAIPADEAEDLQRLLAEPSTNIAEMRRQVMALWPDAPVRAESTWFYWAREARGRGKRHGGPNG